MKILQKSVVLVILTTVSLPAFAAPTPNPSNSLKRSGSAVHAYSQTALAKQFEQAGQSDFRRALQQYRLAAAQGRSDAQYELGRIYADGDGVTRDSNEALKWLELAAVSGHGRAQNRLGVMYHKGQGVSRDVVEAYKWFELAAHSSFAVTAKANRESIVTEMSSGEVVEALTRVAAVNSGGQAVHVVTR